MRFKLLLFTLLCSLAALLPAKAETLTVYDGTTTNNHVPAYMFYWDDFTRSECVIPSTALESMTGGTITAIKFYTNSDNVPYTSVASAYMYMTEVNSTSISNYVTRDNATIVYTGTLEIVSANGGGEVTITFDTPYTYGGGNLVIGTENISDAGYKNIKFYGQTVSGASIAGSSSSASGTIPVDHQDFIPKTTFTYTPSSEPVYYSPKNLTVSNIGPNEATATWTPGGDETSWNVEYKKISDASWTSAGAVSTPTIVLDALANGTSYDVRVQGNYGSGNLSNWATTSFTTLVCDDANKGEVSYVLTDTYGDGWNGNKLQIVYNGTVIEELTISTGGKDEPITGTISLCYGVDYDLVWVAGSYGYECGFVLTAPDGSVIYEFQGTGSSSGGSPTAGILTTFQIHPETCPRPTDLAVSDITAHTANASWNGDANAQSFNLRYRPKALIWDFEDEGQFNEWTLVDADNDGFNWQYFNNTGVTQGRMTAHGGEGLIASASFDNDNSSILYPNNWLISPEILLGGEFSFWAVGQDADYPAEVFGVYVCTNNSTNPSDFVQVGTDNTTTSTYNLYEFDLSAYAGQTGRIAIVHHNISDQFWLNVDDITYVPTEDWITVENVTSPYTIDGLDPETEYEVQVQAVYADGNSGWTNSVIFTTLEKRSTLAEIEGADVNGKYTVSDQLVAVDYRQVGENDVYLWCKDLNHSINPTYIDETTQIDFMIQDGAQSGAWDQSNWVILKLTGTAGEGLAASAKGSYIEAGTITGTYDASMNMINVEGTFTVGNSATYDKNVYCTSNFVESNLGQPGAQTGQNDQYYFFMNPKNQEVCHITYAMWDGEKFTVPAYSGFAGELAIDYSYNTNAAGTPVTEPTLKKDEVYEFDAFVGRSMSKAGGYIVYPGNLTGDDNIVTAINTVNVNGEVVGVEYVNSLGVVSKRPFSGMNIVVTRYSDGTTTSVKKIFK